jgi:hypothetical protein
VRSGPDQPIAMQEVEGSSPFIRSPRKARYRGLSAF